MMVISSRIPIRAAIVLVFVTFGLCAPALAQPCIGPPAFACPLGPPPPTALAADGPGPLGDNIVAIPAFSCVNAVPSCGGLPNGFNALCAIFGLVGTPSSIIQINSQIGSINVYNCNQPVAPPWTPCQAVLIRPSVAAAAVVPPSAPADGGWPYTSYGEGPGPIGDNLYGVPYSMPAAVNPQIDVCVPLGLPAGSQVIRINPFLGVINVHVCGAIPVFFVSPGDGVIIRPLGAPGAAVGFGANC
jgi:hypothetical protein